MLGREESEGSIFRTVLFYCSLILIHLFIFLSIYLSIYRSSGPICWVLRRVRTVLFYCSLILIHLSIYLTIFLSIYLSIYISVYHLFIGPVCWVGRKVRVVYSELFCSTVLLFYYFRSLHSSELNLLFSNGS